MKNSLTVFLFLWHIYILKKNSTVARQLQIVSCRVSLSLGHFVRTLPSWLQPNTSTAFGGGGSAHEGHMSNDEDQTDLHHSPIISNYFSLKSHINEAPDWSETPQKWLHVLRWKILPWWGRIREGASRPERLATCLRITFLNSQWVLKHIHGAAAVHPSQLASKRQPEAAWKHAWGYSALRNPPANLVEQKNK